MSSYRTINVKAERQVEVDITFHTPEGDLHIIVDGTTYRIPANVAKPLIAALADTYGGPTKHVAWDDIELRHGPGDQTELYVDATPIDSYRNEQHASIALTAVRRTLLGLGLTEKNDDD